MVTEGNPDSKQKIVQRVLIGGVTLGVAVLVLRITLAFFGMVGLPSIMNTNTTGVQLPGFIAFLIPYVFAGAPYCIALGAASSFLYAYLFHNKESQGVLVCWGILMILYLIASTYFAWL